MPNIFRWDENNNLITNENNHYQNVFLHTGLVNKGQFENSICVTKIFDEYKTIGNSNYYLQGIQWPSWYDDKYKVFTNIINNYNEIINNTREINLDYECSNKLYFYMIDQFMFSNSGHNLSAMLNCIDYILNNNITDILILKGYKNTNNFKLIELLLPVNVIIHELDINTIYRFNNIIIIYSEFYNILKHNYLIENLKEKIINKYYDEYKFFTDKKILLLKTTRNQNVLQKETQINCNKMLDILESNNFLYIIPEEMCIFKLAIMLLYAKTIVFSTGSILYTNKIFFNENSENIFLTHHNNTSDFNAGGIKITKYIFYSSTDIDNNENYLDLIKQIDPLIIV